MISRHSCFFTCLTGVTLLSRGFVLGFVGPCLSSSNSYSSSCPASTTVLRYVAEANYHGEQYQRYQPHDRKVVDVEVEGNSQFVYIPLHEMEDAVNKAQENHRRKCASMQDAIDKQREELELLKQNKKSDLIDNIQHNHFAESAWDENHDEKMKRITERVRHLAVENERLQAELEDERERFDLEKERLELKLNEARHETAEAQQILSLERSYFETAIKLLEVGLERETKNVKALEDQLSQYNQQRYHGSHHYPFHDDLPHIEPWDSSGTNEQREEHYDYDFHPSHHYDEVFEDFQPQVIPKEESSYYAHDTHIDSHHETTFQAEPQRRFHRQQNGQTSHQHYSRSDANPRTGRSTTATTPVMGASSIRDNMGINDIKDALYH